jgi:glucose/arabinose dehydrogenase
MFESTSWELGAIGLTLGCLVLAACGGSNPLTPPPPGASDLVVEEVAAGLQSPVHLAAPEGDGRLFVVEQAGRIRVVESGGVSAVPFLDIRGIVGAGGERGLLSMAFHPDYSSNGFFYVYYTDGNGDTRVARYTVSSDPNVANSNSGVIVLAIPQPFSNHNGGLLMFGPDGMLYVGMGDGGSGGDPLGHGQDTGTLLGALLRIDVDGGVPYATPGDNPFGNEIWAYGLRNPWRYSFDRSTGLLYIADVGQNRREEINVVAASTPGVNYGWNVMEGDECFDPPSGCNRAGLQIPALEYEHGQGCSVTGGVVYRGMGIPGLQGHYFYSDFCAGWLRSFRFDGGAVTGQTEWEVGDLGNVTSFGEDGAGEMYILGIGLTSPTHHGGSGARETAVLPKCWPTISVDSDNLI